MCNKSGGDVFQTNMADQSNVGSYDYVSAAPAMGMWDGPGGGRGNHGHHGHRRHGRDEQPRQMAFAPVEQSLSQGNWGIGGAGGTDNNIYANTVVWM